MNSTKRTWKRKFGTLLTTGQVAEILGVSPRTIRKIVDTTELPAMKLPGQNQRLIHKDALREFLVNGGYDWSVAALDNKYHANGG